MWGSRWFATGDKSIKNMDDKEWDLVVAVHLKGAYEMTKACWPLFRGQKVSYLSNIFVFRMMSSVQRF